MKFKPQCKTQADLYSEMSRVLRMCEGTEAKPQDGWKIGGRNSYGVTPLFDSDPTMYEFSISIVEGKHVFRGNTLWLEHCGEVTIRGASGTFLKIIKDGEDVTGVAYRPDMFSWNPPKKVPSIPEGFTPWEGGEWTGHPKDEGEVLLRNGFMSSTTKMGNRRWVYGAGITSYDIIAYKITKKFEPETVMVELPIGDAKYLVQNAPISGVLRGVIEACRKKLEEEKLL